MDIWLTFFVLQSFVSTDEVESLAAFLLYAALVMAAVFVIIVQFIPEYGQTHVMFYIGVCSLVGSLSVCSHT